MQTMGSTSKDIKEKDKRLIEGVIQKKEKTEERHQTFCKQSHSGRLFEHIAIHS